MNLSDVIKRPLITEKATSLKAMSNAVLFAVDKRANKKEVREAVEKMVKVKVDDVRTMNVAGKVKRRGRTVGLRPGWKKAVVVLKAGDKIEFFEGFRPALFSRLSFIERLRWASGITTRLSPHEGASPSASVTIF